MIQQRSLAFVVLLAALFVANAGQAAEIAYSDSDDTFFFHSFLAILSEGDAPLLVDDFDHESTQPPPTIISLNAAVAEDVYSKVDIRHQLFADDTFTVDISAQSRGSRADDVGAFVSLHLLYFFAFTIESENSNQVRLNYVFDSSATGIFVNEDPRPVDRTPDREIDLLKGGLSSPRFEQLESFDFSERLRSSLLLETDTLYTLVFHFDSSESDGSAVRFEDRIGTFSMSAQLSVVEVPEPGALGLLMLAPVIVVFRRRHLTTSADHPI